MSLVWGGGGVFDLYLAVCFRDLTLPKKRGKPLHSYSNWKIVLHWCDTFFIQKNKQQKKHLNPRLSEHTHLHYLEGKYFGSALPNPKLTLQE